MKERFYKQCQLVKGNLSTTRWVPVSLCEVGAQLKDGWTVVTVYQLLENRDVESASHDAKRIWIAGCGKDPVGNK